MSAYAMAFLPVAMYLPNALPPRNATVDQPVRDNFLVPFDAVKGNRFFLDAQRAPRQFAVRAVKNRAAVGDEFFYRRFEEGLSPRS